MVSRRQWTANPSRTETGLDVPGVDLGLRVVRWATFEVPFGPGQERELTHTYSVTLTGDVTWRSVVGYVITTGGLWAEPIGHIRVEFEMGPVKPSSISWLSPAPGFRYEGGDPGSNTWVYEASDLRPKHNPKMWFYTRDWSELELASWDPPERQAVLDRQAGYAAVDLHREDARWLLDFHAAIVQKACSHEDYLSKGDLATLARYAASFLTKRPSRSPLPRSG